MCYQNIHQRLLVKQIVVVIHLKNQFIKRSFWVGLVASIVFFTYFEVQNYNSENQKVTETEQQTVPVTEKATEACCADDTKCE